MFTCRCRYITDECRDVYFRALNLITLTAAPGRTRNRYQNITVDCDDLDRLDETGRYFTVIGDRAHHMPWTYEQAVQDHCPLMYHSEAVIRAFAR